MRVIKKIGVRSVAKIYGSTLVGFGAIIAIPYGLFWCFSFK